MPRVYTATRAARASLYRGARVAKIAQVTGRETAVEMVNLEELVKMGYL